MKQFIILIAILPFMLIFTIQYSLEQQRNSQFLELERQVYISKEIAKQEGFFSEENIINLREKIAKIFKIDVKEVQVEGDSVPRYRVNSFDERELIHYKVTVPIRNVMAGAKFFGLTEEENTLYYVIESDTISERLKGYET